MYKCKACKKRFQLTAENRYTARIATKTGIISAMQNEEPTLFDAFDCPYCGCQNLLNVRERQFEYIIDEEGRDEYEFEEVR
jgi:DNA-directed RNA polymerase subunit RPC12/RpoP